MRLPTIFGTPWLRRWVAWIVRPTLLTVLLLLRPPPAACSLCCLCGTNILPNPSNMCVSCIRSQVDITEGIQKQVGPTPPL